MDIRNPPCLQSQQDQKKVHQGVLLFNSNCFFCHGRNAVAGPIADLRYLNEEKRDSFASIVLGGSRSSEGMPSFRFFNARLHYRGRYALMAAFYIRDNGAHENRPCFAGFREAGVGASITRQGISKH